MNFNLPEFTNFYKFFLIDELALCDNPALIHYGNCSVIGYLSSFDSISSLSIPNLPEIHQLPDCHFNVRLLMDPPINLINSTVEIFGEVKLYDATEAFDKKLLESAHSLIQKLGILQTKLEAAKELPPRPPSGTNDKSLHPAVKGKLQKEIEVFKKCYKPVIQVHYLKHISEAREIIAENLQYRIIQNYRKNRRK